MTTKPKYRRWFLQILQSDTEARLSNGQWLTSCLHCRTALALHANGNAIGDVSVEHVIPSAWFGKRAARALCAQVAHANDPRNLALACRRCNLAKGTGPDARGPADPRAYEIVCQLFERRAARYRGAEAS